MVIFKGKIRQRREDGEYDYILPETTADQVYGLEEVIDAKLDTINDTINSVKNNALLANSINTEFQGFIPAQQNLRAFQSVCYVPKDNVIVVGYSEAGQNNGDTLSDIVKFNLSDFSVVNTYSDLTLYHVNDLTYNPLTDEVIVATLSKPEETNRISVLDYTTMEIKRNVNVSDVTNLASIAYNVSKNQYVAYVTGGLIVLDDNYSRVNFISWNKYPNFVLQCVESFDDFIFIYWNNLIQVLDFEGNLLREWYMPVNNEAEGIAYLGDGDMLIGQVSNHSYRYNSRLFKFNIHQEKNISKWAIQNNLNDLGLVEGDETITAIAVSMSDHSIFIYDKNTDNTSSEYPTTQGLLKVTKVSVDDVYFEFWSINNEYFTGNFNNSRTVKFTGWTTTSLKSRANSADLNTLTTEGFMYVFAANGNVPESTSGYLTIENYSASYARQRFEPSYATGQHYYIRNYSNSVWGAWHSFYAQLNGSGSPEGIVNGRVGNTYVDTTGGILYFKASGMGSTGWKRLTIAT